MAQELRRLIEAEEAPRAYGEPRVLAKDGVWQVRPALRPPGWREMGLKEPKVQGRGRSAKRAAA